MSLTDSSLDNRNFPLEFLIQFMIPSALFGAIAAVAMFNNDDSASKNGAMGALIGASLTLSVLLVLIQGNAGGSVLKGNNLEILLKWLPVLYVIIAATQAKTDPEVATLVYFDIIQPFEVDTLAEVDLLVAQFHLFMFALFLFNSLGGSFEEFFGNVRVDELETNAALFFSVALTWVIFSLFAFWW